MPGYRETHKDNKLDPNKRYPPTLPFVAKPAHPVGWPAQSQWLAHQGGQSKEERMPTPTIHPQSPSSDQC
jgi:hypothetical protein